MRTFFALVVFVFLAAGCSSGKKAFEKGNYEKAFSQAVNRLRSNGDHKKSRTTLRKAYPLALEVERNRIERSKMSNDPLRWEEMIYSYQQINAYHDQILRCPACREVIPNPIEYTHELTMVKQKAAKVRYDLGMEALKQKQDRQRAVDAHQHFLMADEFVPGFKDVDKMLQEALYHATLKVVVEPVPSPQGIFNLQHEFFNNKINEYLHNARINDYVQFFTPNEAAGLEYVDHVVQMEFDRFTFGNVRSHTSEKEVSRDSVEIGKKNGEPIYGTVKAKMKVNEKSITSRGVLDFKVYDSQHRRVISQEKFPGETIWAVRWASYNGDERALSDEELEMVNTKVGSIPNPQYQFEQMALQFYDQVTHKMHNYYSHF